MFGNERAYFRILPSHLHINKGLNERIIDLVKKRSQLKQAVAKMVTEACTFLDKTPDKV